ncbi:MAG: hypothetical protein LBS72_04860 [Oscillospiraceae bacterium]|nr:hypothetical protein [Oscillospiraceae bacterium]
MNRHHGAMTAGYGKATITPPLRVESAAELAVELAGYGYFLRRRAENVLDDLYARALYIETDTARWMLICCDLLGLAQSVVERIFTGLHERYGLNREQVTIVSVHTHTGPAIVAHTGCGEVDLEYTSGVANKILGACDEAIQTTATVTALTGTVTPLNGIYVYNRSDSDAPIDNYVRGLRIERDGGCAISLVSHACHPVFRGRIPSVSADYPGEVNALFEKNGEASIYLNGVCGDIDPYIPSGVSRSEQLARYARSIQEGFNTNHVSLATTLTTRRFSYELGIRPMTAEDVRETADRRVARIMRDGVPPPWSIEEGAARVVRIWEQTMLVRIDREGALAAVEPVSISAVCLGGVWIVALPYEAFTCVGQIARENGAGNGALILGCAEELRGYLPARKDYELEAYASQESAFLYKRQPIMQGEAERFGAWIGGMCARIQSAL